MAATITRKLVSLAEAADAVAVSTKTVRRYIAAGQLDALCLGRKTLRIKVDSVEWFVDARPVYGWRAYGLTSRQVTQREYAVRHRRRDGSEPWWVRSGA